MLKALSRIIRVTTYCTNYVQVYKAKLGSQVQQFDTWSSLLIKQASTNTLSITKSDYFNPGPCHHHHILYMS